MGFFFRRSETIGPFRFNFSRSGVGASVGVKGARLTMTSRGTTYVTVGSHGFYYRETLSGQRVRHSVPRTSQSTFRLGESIISADSSALVDSSSERLIKQLNERANMFNPAWIIYGVALFSLLALCLVSTPSALADQNKAAGRRTLARRR